MLKTFWAILCLCICGLAGMPCAAEIYDLADGTKLIGEPVTFSDTGVRLRTEGDKLSDLMPWTKFSQEGLLKLAENPKIEPLVKPFIEPPPAEKNEQTDNIKLQPVTRLALEPPPGQFLLGAMVSSSVGLVLLLMIYAANLYAAYEVASCRARPLGVVMGLSAVLPVVGPAIFFAMPTNMQSPQNLPPGASEAEIAAAAAANAIAAAGSAASPNPADANPSEAVMAAVAAAARAARSRAATTSGETTEDALLAEIQISAISAAPKEAPVTQTFKRGQFTFNRRFIETKFAGFMQPTRSEADQKLEFSVKIASGTHVVQRIARVGANEVHLEVLQDQQLQEIMVPFADIQEVTIKSKTT